MTVRSLPTPGEVVTINVSKLPRTQRSATQP